MEANERPIADEVLTGVPIPDYGKVQEVPVLRAARARVALEPQEMLDKHTSELGKKKKELKELERLHKTQRDWESDNPVRGGVPCGSM